MSVIRWFSLGALLAFAGCDVGVALLMSSKDDGGSGSDEPPALVAPPPVPAPEFSVAVAWLPDDTAGNNALTDLVASNGNLSGSTWTVVGSSPSTAEFDPSQVPNTINTVLIKATPLKNFRLDSLEILDGQNRVVDHASGTVWSHRVASEGNLLGTPDGAGAVTDALGEENAFIFTRFSGPIDRVRVNAYPEGGTPGGGDVLAVGGYVSNYNEKPGGMAIDPSNGRIHLTLTVKDDARLVRFGIDTSYEDEALIDGAAELTYGSHGVALNSNGQIFTAASKDDGKVIIRSFQSNLSPAWSKIISSNKNFDRVESNGIAVDGSGNVIVAGGMNTSNQGVNHWLAKLSPSTGTVIWDFRPGDDKEDTYWRAVTTGPSDKIYTTGNHTSGLFGVVQALTGRFNSAGAGEWEHMFGDGDLPDDAGNAVARDPAGNLFMAGFVGTATEGRNAILLRYSSTGNLTNFITFNGLASGDDEILDIAVDSDSSIYAVGYETVAGQGKNIWIRKYDAFLNPIWTRTHDGGVGDDAAASVAIHGNQLVVAGYETVTGGMTKLVLRVYEK